MIEKSEKRICENCQKDFLIEPNDFSYYEKIGVLSPKLCPECRAQLRLTFKNERFFYKSICGNCKKKIISMYSPNKTYPVWCQDCWWSDDLNPKSYGILYDKNKPFFEQFKEIFDRVPKQALAGFRNINSNFLNFTADNKNCYMIIESSNNENCINCYWIQISKDLVDCSFTHKVELSYEVDDCYSSHDLRFSKSCYNCFDCAFIINCRNCNDCLGCINLRGQKYNIFNKQYTQEEYKKKLALYQLDTYHGVEKFRKEFENFIKDKPRKFAEAINTINSTGNYLSNVRNDKHCFHSYEAEDNSYSTHVWRGAKDCVDCNTAGRSAERMYNCMNCGIEGSNLTCCFYGWTSQFMEYCQGCPNSQHLFGCVSMVKNSYCILNKQYSREEYERLREEIIEKMKREGIYGEFFPKNISPFGYNESAAMDEFPLTKEEVLKQGFKWEDHPRGTYGKETIDWKTFPDSILDVPKDFDVLKEVFVCIECKKNYRIITDELSFYRRMQIPIPRNCPECRHIRRVQNRGPNKLWHRKCMNNGCLNEFETNYAPDRPEIIYCESCYNKEVY